MNNPTLLGRSAQATRGIVSQQAICTACAATKPSRGFSVLNRPPPNYPGHVPLTRIERAGLAVGSGVMSLINPYRHGTLSDAAESTLPRNR